MGDKVPKWFVYNYGRRCTLVCAVSALRFLGADLGLDLVSEIEKNIDFYPSLGPSALNYFGLGRQRPKLDLAVEMAGKSSGLIISAQTIAWPNFDLIKENYKANDSAFVLNCFMAPGGRFNHSVLAYDVDLDKTVLRTIDPNNGVITDYKWGKLNFVVTLTIIKLV